MLITEERQYLPNDHKMWIVTRTICLIVLSVWLLSSDNIASAKRILIIAPTPFYSHHAVYRPLFTALSKRGHELVVLTGVPAKDPALNNYTEINFSVSRDIVKRHRFSEKPLQMSMMEANKELLGMTHSGTVEIFKHAEFQEIYRRNSSERFDAVIVETVTGPGVCAFAHRFDAPLIGLMSVNIHNFHRYVFGSPIIPSHPSNWELNEQFGENPSFWQKLESFIGVWRYLYYWSTTFLNMEEASAKKYLGDDIPHVIDIMKNMSILLVNQNPVISYPRPELTNVIFFNSFHIQKPPPALSKELKQFLDDATDGFIYVSLGTNADWHLLSDNILENFVEVFSKLPYKIVWKCDFNQLPRKLDNAFISNWLPQQSILAHPNIKLFIYQGGLQSTEEAVHYTVPLLGIPIMYDQGSRVEHMASLGVGRLLKLNKFTREDFDASIRQTINDKRYKERMVHLSALAKDQPYDSMENVLWWIEFVMRHNGAPHLRFTGSDQPWYQRYDLDIIAMLTTILFIITCTVALIIFQIIHFAFKRCYRKIFFQYYTSRFLSMKKQHFH